MAKQDIDRDVADGFSDYPFCFGVDDLPRLIMLEGPCQREIPELPACLQNDERFVVADHDGAKLLVSRTALYQWFVNLNIRLAARLAASKEYELNEQRLALSMSSLLLNSRFFSCPEKYLNFGAKLGLVLPMGTDARYSFPMAYILSFMASSLVQNIRKYLLFNPSDGHALAAGTTKDIAESVNVTLGSFDVRTQKVITLREGVFGEQKRTLEDIGRLFEVTRERIRQVEAKFWKRMYSPHGRLKIRIAVALVSYLAHRRGSTIISEDEITPELRFAAKCVGIPCSKLRWTQFWVLGDSGNYLSFLKRKSELTDDEKGLAKALIDYLPNLFVRDDYAILAKSLMPVLTKRLNKSERVYLALKEVGEPAHFSQVTEVYNEMFPDDESSEHTIHAILTRGENGIVWVGRKGTYALEEWGYTRPSMSLFEAVTKIVRRKHLETRRPVPLIVIEAEIGKYRKLVRGTINKVWK